jgi:hypothetical protein
MKTRLMLLALAGSLAGLPAQEVQSTFDAFSPAQASPEWQPNPSLWRELTASRTNPPVSLGESGLRASGPLVDAWQTARRARGPRPSLRRSLLAIPTGLGSLIVPQPMPKPPEAGGRYLPWRENNPAPWVLASAGAAPGPGLADNPLTREPRNSLLNTTWRDERKPEIPGRMLD